MEAYIKIPVDIKPFANWVRELEGKLKPLHSVRFAHRYHITAVFFNAIDTERMSEVATKMGETLCDIQPVSVTFDKIDIFKDCSGHYIVYLATKNDSYNPLIEKLRDVAKYSGAAYREDFKFHITLAIIDIDNIDEVDLRKILSGVVLPTFNINLSTVELINRSSKNVVASWHLPVTNPEK